MLTQKQSSGYSGVKPRRMRATFIAWVNNVNNVRSIYGENREGLIKESERILQEITPKGRASKASLWRNGKIIANIKFSCRVRK